MTQDIFASGASVADQRTERAQRAVRAFRAMQHGLSGYARAITGNKNIVVQMAQGVPRTDGKNIFFKPPIALGDLTPHDRGKCERRDPRTKLMLCSACRVREEVLISIYHEIAHIVFGTFEEPTSKAKAEALQRAVEEVGTKYASRVKAAFDRLPEYKQKDYLNLSSLISPFLPVLVNALEDARVDEGMFKARKGTKVMFDAYVHSIFANGFEEDDGSRTKWSDKPLNSQALIGVFVLACGYKYEGWFAPEVERALSDKRLRELASRVDTLRSAEGSYNLAFPILARLRELGFCRLEQDPEDDQTEPEEPETDEEAEPQDEDQADSDADSGQPDAAPDDPVDEDSDENSGEEAPDDEDGSEPDDDDEADREAEGSGSGESEPDDEAEDSESGQSDDGDSSPQDDVADDGAGEDGPDDGGEGEADESGEDGGASSVPDDGSGDSEPSDEAGEYAGRPEGDSDDGDSDGEPSDSAEPSNSGASRGDAGESSGEPSSEDSDESGELSDGEGTSEGAGRSDRESGSAADDSESDRDADGHDSDAEGELSDDGEDSELDADSERSGAEAKAGDRGGEDHEGEGSDRDTDADPSGDSDGDSLESEGHGDYEDSGSSDDSFESLEDDEVIDSGADEGQGGTETDDDRYYGSSDEVLKDFQVFSQHEVELAPPTGEEQADDKAIEVAIIQGMYFEKPSANVTGVREHKYGVPLLDARGHDISSAWRDIYGGSEYYAHQARRLGIETNLDIPESVLGPALLEMRRAFADNQRAEHQRHLKSGRVNSRVLGKRAWNHDERLFQKKRLPGKKSYAVLIGIDISGSTVGVNIALAKRAAMAQAELCARMGIDFAVYAHTADGGRRGNDLYLDVYEIKAFDKPWNEKAKEALGKISSSAENLDGHTIEYYRKMIERHPATDKIILYYSDGKMPAANHDEELEILVREIGYCKSHSITLMGVGIRTDSPRRHGLNTVQVNDDSDMIKVVRHLESELLRHR